jgi:PP-loop superfamily ATP-utilizing enzyme
MNYLDFTAEETSLIAIYAEETRAATVAAITAALPYMDTEMRDIASRSAAKLAVMTDCEFEGMTFTPDEEPGDAA